MLIRTSSAGSTTGTHAFIVGVSHYPFADGPDATEWGESSGIANLTGAARSASDVAAWLLEEYNNPDAPLASVRILLSPVEEEDINPVVAALMGDASAPATRSAVETEFFDFREECRRSPQNVGFVYVAGHGVQLNKRGSVVLLQDFAIARRDFLYGAIDMVGCHDAMDELGNAHHQLWFSDACRQHPDIARRFETLSGAYRPGEEGRGQVDSTPLFMAASSRESAFATVGGTTIFCQALLTGLRGAAASGPKPQAGIYQWHVPVTGLIEYLPAKVNALLAGIEDQHVDIAGRPCPMVAHQFDAPPEVEIVVNLEPSDAQSVAVPTLTFGSIPVNVVQSWPLRYRGSAGIYAVAVKAKPPFKDGYGDFMALPPAHECKVQVN